MDNIVKFIPYEELKTMQIMEQISAKFAERAYGVPVGFYFAIEYDGGVVDFLPESISEELAQAIANDVE